MTPYNPNIINGADWSVNFAWADESGTPIDLTGYTFSWQFKKNFTAQRPELILTLGDGITVDTPTSGAGSAVIERLSLPPGDYHHAFFAISPGGLWTTLSVGIFTVLPSPVSD